ncbi:MAG: prepilin-type N-terminal cleavage/methylation domain-containing protein [Eubacteriaceae bacterium]|nr:prepilin-type N-terminal cleavage/methylation domain-containing protein [Eubacteriaceae bacterium]
MRYYAGKKINNGFTLIEVIVSIAIIAILLMAGIYMLSGSITTIAGEGKDTDLLYQAQDVMEKLTADVPVTASSYPKLSWTTPTAVTITMTGSGGTTVNVAGKLYTIKDTANNVILKSFVPDATSP